MISSLLQKINEIDTHLYYFITKNLKNPLFDKWMPIITDLNNWIWILALGWLALLFFGGRKGRIVCVVIVLAVLFADNFNSYILKPFFGRVRPNIALGVIDIMPSKISPSFPSNHATNVFAQAMVLSWFYRRVSPIFFLGACIVGFSRVYVGVHYLLDVVAGAFVGIICALLFIWLTNRIDNYIKSLRASHLKSLQNK